MYHLAFVIQDVENYAEAMLRKDSLFADITVYLPSGTLACLLSSCV